MRNYWEDTYFEQPTEKLLKQNSTNTIRRSAQKGKMLAPVVIEGRKIAKSWWGEAWCNNLERYADYASRLERGKRYVRSGTVLDLQIRKGRVSAKVQGSRKLPYKVEIRISPISEEHCQQLLSGCQERIETMDDLINGKFPDELKDTFLQEGGLFPTSKEISFSCSCPDWALMCKHVAAVLYGIGARFDENPLMFFELRGIDVNKFIDIAVANRIEQMLANAEKPSSRILEDADCISLFGLI